jgi:hypothetical protein
VLDHSYAEEGVKEQIKKVKQYQNVNKYPNCLPRSTRACVIAKEAIQKKRVQVPKSNFKLSRFQLIPSKTETYARISLKQIDELQNA